jgi:hypothetical protein
LSFQIERDKQDVERMAKNTQLFNDLPPTLILETHYEVDELNQLRRTLESHGCTVTSSIFHAELIITKLTQEKRARREVYEIIRMQNGDIASATKDIDVVKEKWIWKCIDNGKLVDWPFIDSPWRIVRIAAIKPITPPKRQRSPDKFAVPGEPASKRRTLSRSGSVSITHRGPSGTSAPLFKSASSDDPSSKQFYPSQTSTVSSDGEEDDKFDYREVYSCRRKTPLISHNETFVKLLVEIRLARELALYTPSS